MAKVYLRGGITHDIQNDEAEKIKESWKAGRRDIVDLGNISFNTSEIKSIVLDTDTAQAEYNEWEAKEFEKVLGSRTFDQYCLEQRFYRYDEPNHVQVVNYNTISQYNEAKGRNRNYDQLKERRSYAKKMDLDTSKLVEQVSVQQEMTLADIPW